jgi:hypothetical protein
MKMRGPNTRKQQRKQQKQKKEQGVVGTTATLIHMFRDLQQQDIGMDHLP